LFKNETKEPENNEQLIKPRQRSYWWVWVITIIILIGGGIAYSYFTKPPTNPYITEAASIQDIVQSVEVTGSIEPAQEFNLNFKSAGTIDSVNVKVGDDVKQGQVLASLDTSELNSQLAQSQASVNVAQAQLQQAQEGSRPEEIAVQETNVNNAQTALTSAQINYQLTQDSIDNELQTAQTSLTNTQKLLKEAQTNLNNIENQSDQNIKNTIDTNLNQINLIMISEQSVNANIEEIYRNQSWHDTFEKISFSLTRATDNLRDKTNSLKSKAASSYNLASISKSETDTQTAINDTLDYLNNTTQILTNTGNLIYEDSAVAFFGTSDLANLTSRQASNQSSHNNNLNNALSLQNSIDTTKISNQISIDNANNQIITYQNQIQTAEENIESIKITSHTKLQQAEDQIDNAANQLKIQQKQLELTKAGPTAATIAVANAQVSQAQAAVKIIQTQIANQQIIAPIDGKIIQVNADAGEQSNSTNPIIQMHSHAQYEINADIAETDIDKIKLGHKAIIDFDALTKNEKFTGTVVETDPSATIIQGVVYYNTKIILDNSDPRIKPGMTANIEIITAEAKQIITVPNQAVKNENDQSYVEILTDTTTLTIEKINVTTGLRGNTLTEIKSGLGGGENVIILKNE